MKRLDRAMYAIFLLALLADFALSQVAMPVGSESVDRLMLSSSGPLGIGVGRASVPMLPADGSLRSAGRLKSYRLAASGLARIFSGESRSSSRAERSAPVMLAGLMAGQEIGTAIDASRAYEVASLAPKAFAHTSSPAP